MNKMEEYTLYIGTGKYNAIETKQKIVSIAETALDGFTLLQATGFYRGTYEDCFVLITLANEEIRYRVRGLAIALRSLLDQTSILMTEKEVKVTFIEE